MRLSLSLWLVREDSAACEIVLEVVQEALVALEAVRDIIAQQRLHQPRHLRNLQGQHGPEGEAEGFRPKGEAASTIQGAKSFNLSAGCAQRRGNLYS